ncbi:acyl carrier protein [Streptomyces sp. NPDC021096]|uniref:acyl carrier protein n=1 Tax=Streptomyces sp. NPDC021096 TaxID=3154792 RepID=UPI003407FB6E
MTLPRPDAAATPALTMLSDLARPERRDALEDLVRREFRAVLLMTDEEDLPADQSYFDLGLTSLSITRLKQRLEELLSVELDANLLFNSPTLEKLLEHLTEGLLADLFHAPAPAPDPAEPTPADAGAASFLDAALKDLYER